MFKKHPSTVTSITLDVRATTPRNGREHIYTLNGSRLRDVLVDGRWVTVAVDGPTVQRTVA